MHHYSVINWNKKVRLLIFQKMNILLLCKKHRRWKKWLQKHSAIMDKYDPQKKIALVVDEWGGWYDVEPGTNGAFLFQQNTMRDAMIAGSL